MRGTIDFGGKSVELVANGATPVLYKRVFRRDFLSSANKADDMDVYVELAFIMAKQAEKPMAELINSLKYEDYLEWIISIHPPLAGRDAARLVLPKLPTVISIHPPLAGRDL